MRGSARIGLRLISSVCASIACLLCAPAHAQAPAATAAVTPVGPGSLNGLWTTPGYKGSARTAPRDRVLKTIDGKMPPLLPAAAALLEKRVALAEQGQPFDNTLTQCLPGGVPLMTSGSPYPIQILENPGQVTILYEEENHFRIVHLNGTHPSDPDPTYMGHSIGHWDGDTLVVDTVGQLDTTTLDEVGMPHSDALHVIERYRRTDSKTLEITITIDDPKTFSRPWDTKVVYKAAAPRVQMLEFICENNRSVRE